MRHPLQITFQDLRPSPAVEARVRAKVEHLEKHFQGLISCRITLGETSRNPNPRANWFFCHIDLRVPGREIAAGRPDDSAELRAQHKNHKDIYLTIRDAFAGAERALREHARMLRDRSREVSVERA